MRCSKLYVVSRRPKHSRRVVVRDSVQEIADFKVVKSGASSDPRFCICLAVKSLQRYSIKIVLKNSTKVQLISKFSRKPYIQFWWYLRWSLANVEYLLKIKNMRSATSEVMKLAPLFSPWYEKVRELNVAILSIPPSSDHVIYMYILMCLL